MKNWLKRTAAAALTLALLTAPVLAVAEPIGKNEMNLHGYGTLIVVREG